MRGVVRKRIGDFAKKVGSGATPKGGEAAYKSSGIPLIRSMNVHFDGFRSEGLAFLDESQALALKNVEVQKDDVLLNITGASIGRVTLAPSHVEGGRVNQHVCIVRPDESVSSSYLRWFLASPLMQRQIDSMESGATRQALTKEKILSFEVPVPSLDEQHRIVAEIDKQFSRLDEAVANLQRVKANLKRYKAAVLKAAVEGRLVETEASLARREGRTYETGEQLLQRILGERRVKWLGKGKYKEPEPPVLDGLDPLPEGWLYATTEQMCEQIASGSTPSPEAMFSGAGEVPFLKVYNLTFDGSLDFTVKPTYVADTTHQGLLARSRSIPGDVLMNIVGPPLGKVSIVPSIFPEWNINQAIVTFRTSPGLVNRLLAHWLLAQPVLSRLERTANRHHIYLDWQHNKAQSRFHDLSKVLAVKLGGSAEVACLEPVTSSNLPLLGLADVLIGAVGYAWNGLHGSPFKQQLCAQLASIGGFHSLAVSTAKGAYKVNIFRFDGGARA